MLKPLVITALAVLGCLTLSGCSLQFGTRREVKATGDLLTRTAEGSAARLTVKDIYVRNGMSTGGPQVELLSDGGAARVEAEAQASVLEEIKITFSGGHLQISANGKRCYVTSYPVTLRLYNFALEDLRFSGACSVSDTVGLGREDRALTVSLSGASRLASVFLRADTLKLTASGASRIDGTKLTADTLKIGLSGASSFRCPEAAVASFCDWDVSGASTLEISGTGKELKADVSGASRVKSFEFRQESGKIDVSGASTLEGAFSAKLSGNASGASHVYYQGDPETDIDVSGASSAGKR